ncbi:MAG: hypothetical protein IJ770_04505 [Alphaproteobacteria bacterium]|nr:hypothetical protein [Alphaproteobacteria bacterium]
MYNYGFSKWLEDLQIVWQNLPDALVYSVLTVATYLFVISMCFSVIRIFTRSMVFDIAGREDILQDKLQNPHSWYDGTYELPAENIKKSVNYANLSYHTFWNAVIMYRYRICGDPWNKLYFRVNRWSSNIWFPLMAMVFQTTMLCSLCFIWGYPIFYVIARIRMKHYSKTKTLY